MTITSWVFGVRIKFLVFWQAEIEYCRFSTSFCEFHSISGTYHTDFVNGISKCENSGFFVKNFPQMWFCDSVWPRKKSPSRGDCVKTVKHSKTRSVLEFGSTLYFSCYFLHFVTVKGSMIPDLKYDIYSKRRAKSTDLHLSFSKH